MAGGSFGSSAGDELGDLARSFSEILDKQRQHTAYLEQVGKRLSHEIRTPVGVVRSSLDNLRLQDLPDDARVYLERADEGLRRLATILSRMSEATRLEQVLAGSEREAFDLAAVVRGCVEGYRLANPGREILTARAGRAAARRRRAGSRWRSSSTSWSRTRSASRAREPRSASSWRATGDPPGSRSRTGVRCCRTRWRGGCSSRWCRSARPATARSRTSGSGSTSCA